MSKEKPSFEELMGKAKTAESPEALIQMAEKANIKLSALRADSLYEALNKKGALSDDELENVIGGGCGSKPDSVTHSQYEMLKAGWESEMPDGITIE
jgi:hypothetical protein